MGLRVNLYSPAQTKPPGSSPIKPRIRRVKNGAGVPLAARKFKKQLR
jgi:hypothetical protein